MHNPLFDNHFEHLVTSGTLIISSNHRLKLSLQNSNDQIQATHGSDKEPAAIYALDEWIQLCWQQLPVIDRPHGAKGILLSSNQELFFWNSLVENDETAFWVTPHTSTVKAFEAVKLLGLYLPDAAESQKSYGNADHELFLGWLTRFRKACLQRKFITHTDQVKALIRAYERQRLKPAPHIILMGFIRIPPLYQRLLELASIKLSRPEFNTGSALPRQVVCESASDEIVTAGRWAKQKLTENPQQLLGILVPDLSQRRIEVNRILHSIFSPEQPIPGSQRGSPVFNVSAAPALGHAPLVFAARAVLSLNRPLIDLETGVALLWSPFFLSNDSCDEAIIQARAVLCGKRKPVISLADIKDSLSRSCGGIATQYLDKLDKFSRLLKQRPNHRMLTSGWATLFSEQLTLLGWPGKRPLSSTEFQQLHRWHKALIEFSTLDPIYGPVNLTKALELLDQWLDNIDFQAQSADCPVQILGTLECLSLPFDALWITGLNDDQWPAPVNPNPFLPIALQRQLQMPHCDPGAELEYARRLMTNYQAHTRDLIASHSRYDGDRPRRPSSLIKAWVVYDNVAQQTHSQIHHWTGPDSINAGSHGLFDLTAPALKSTQEPLPGGAAILKDQSLCPFRAFAIHRLRAREKQLPQWHISESQRGQMLHRSMQVLWEQLGNHQALVTASTTQITALVNHAIQMAMDDLVRQRPDLTTELFIDAEKDRLHRQLALWLEIEAQRKPFKVIATELESVIQVDADYFRIRIDRLDELIDTGEIILVDYKTGDCSLADWQGERPRDPQLPLYGVGLNLPLTGQAAPRVVSVAFARINATEQRFLGIASRPDLAPGIETPDKLRGWTMPGSWPQIEQHWLERIRVLVKEFKDGVARVDPAAGACQYCHLKPLCRVNDHRLNTRLNL